MTPVQSSTEKFLYSDCSPCEPSDKKTSEIVKASSCFSFFSQMIKREKKEEVCAYPLNSYYWVESASGGQKRSDALSEVYELWKEDPNTLTFKEYLQQRHAPFSLAHIFNKIYHTKKLSYLRSEEERKPFIAEIKEGRLCCNALAECKVEESIRLLYVFSTESKLYVRKKGERKHFNHSCFMGGRPVFSAGEIQVTSEGVIQIIDNDSGHYQPDIQSIITFASFLKNKDVNLKEIEIHIYNCSPTRCIKDAQGLLQLTELDISIRRNLIVYDT